MSLKLLSTPEPHYIPGYTGYCPQYVYRLGNTFGTLTHKLLIDPNTRKGDKSVLSYRKYDDFHVRRQIDLIKGHEDEGDPVYTRQMVPGYEGFIPQIQDKFGKRFLLAATESIAEFEEHMQRKRCEDKMMRHRTAFQGGTNQIRSLGDRKLRSTDYRLPLHVVRPECQGVLRREVSLPEERSLPYSRSTPPHFMLDNNPEKFIKSGFSGHIPFSYDLFGETNLSLTKKSLCSFSSHYRHARHQEWAPIDNRGAPVSRLKLASYEIYSKTSGLIPRYSGYVPGSPFRFGKSFGKETIDAKRWLRSETM